MKKKSIQIRLVITLTALVIFIIFLCWFMNKTFLGKYYISSKLKELNTAFNQVNQLSEEKEKFTEEQSEITDRLAANNNMNIYVVYDVAIGLDAWDLAPTLSFGLQYPLNLNNMQQEQLGNRLVTYISLEGEGGKKDRMELMASSDKYNVYKVFDTKIQSNYIELYGTLESGSNIYIRTNFESIQESVKISNKFLGYVGLIGGLLGIIVMLLVSRSFTRPILELSELAKKMSDLNFDVKYEVKTKDEIGILGQSINALSEKLEHAISDLKSANNELKLDIENKIQIDEMRKEFLANVSHELKTPIALIQGYSEGLKENINEDIESKDFYCEVIIDEANKMNKMVKKLLTLNQIEFGNNQIVFERFDIVMLLQSVLASTEILAQQKGATIQFEETQSLYVWGDEYMIEEVVTNYVSNAFNHLDGEKIISISLTKKEDVVRISVFNTGEKIPEEEMDNIWIKFYKVDKARTREYGGSGIGLSIVKAIMTSLNRECGAINHENGVEFWFELDIKNE